MGTEDKKKLMTHSRAAIVVLLLTLISISSLLVWMFFFPDQLLIEQLRTRSRSIIDGNGKIILIRGLNYLEVTNIIQRLPNTSELEQIKGWGFNLIRLPIYWENLEPIESEVNQTFIERYIDPVVGWCQDNEMYILLDMHQWHTSSHFIYEPEKESRGIGFPPWLCEGYDSEDPFLYDWWKNSVKNYPGGWDTFAGLWCTLAGRYRNDSYLAGYDIFNEPNRPSGMSEEEFNSKLLPAFYEYVMKTVMKVDAHHIFFFEGQDGDTKPSLEKPGIDAKLIYTQHAYTTNYSLEGCRELLTRATSKTQKWEIPLWIGEFGASQNAESFAYNMTRALDEKIEAGECSGWCWWCYLPENSENSTSVIDSSYEPKPVLEVLLDSIK